MNDIAFCDKVYHQFLIDMKDCKKIDFQSFKFPKVNAFDRILHERNKLIREDLKTSTIKKDLEAGNYKAFPIYEFIDIS